MLKLLLPPACREEVLGDLHERYSGRLAYLADACSAVPCVIWSRIRRTTDPQVLLMEALALYLSFVGAARLFGQTPFLYTPWGLLRLAIPAAVALLALILIDAYADPAKRSPVRPMIHVAAAIGFAFLSQASFQAADPQLAVPLRIMFYGGGMGLVLLSALHAFFAPGDHRPRGAT